MPIKHTRDQDRALDLLAGEARYIELRGGARSGKTVLFIEALLARAASARQSRHLISRFRGNSLGSIFGPSGTFWWVMDNAFPPEFRERTSHNGKMGYYLLPNAAEVWYGGLDDPKRVDKLLGNEYCLDPASRVLTADLRWVRADSLEPGRELIGVPEELEGHTTLVRSTVERAEMIEAEKLLIITDRGATTVSVGHGFVTRFDDRRTRDHRRYSWRKAIDLSVGDCIRFAAAPWTEGIQKGDGWFAGILDGEGWASVASGNVGVAQCQGAVLDNIRRWVATNGIECREHVGGGMQGKKGPCMQVIAKGIWPSMRMLGIARPVRLDMNGVWEGRRAFTAGGYDAEVLQIIPLGRGPVVALGTSTKTLIADGFLGHNCTIYVNEASQVPYGSFTTVLTRLAQNAKRDDGNGYLRQRCYVDDNPPAETHWLPMLFQKKIEPLSRRPLANPLDYTTMMLNPEGNKENLDPAFLKSLDQLPERQRKRFYLGLNGDAGEAALWTSELLDQQRILDTTEMPAFVRIVVAIDPSGADDIEDTTADEIGIAVVALGTDGCAYLLEDLTMRGSPGEWGKVATDAYDRHMANMIIAESNYGGAMVRHVVQTAKPGVPYQEVTASRGKVVRAEPVSALYEARKVFHVGRFPDLEDEMCAMTTAGYIGTKSPNRADALVWAVTALFPKIITQARVENASMGGTLQVQRTSIKQNVAHANRKKRW